MARLRYMENSRAGEEGTTCTHKNKLFFDDENAYINASASGTLDLVATTVQITGDLDVSGALSYGSETVNLSQNLQGTFTVGQNATGYDVKFYGDTAGKYWLWDESADGVVVLGTMSITGNTLLTTTSKLYFHDAGGEYIYASGDGVLVLAAATSFTATATTLGLVGVVAVTGTITSTGALTISPAGSAASEIDFALETEWKSGTLINADYGSSTTLDGDVVGVNMDFNTNVTAATDCDITGYRVTFTGLDAANNTAFTGFDLPTADAIDTSANTFNWKGVNIQLPDLTQGGTATNSYGIYVAAGSYTSGNEYGVYITGTQTGVAIAGAVVAGIAISGAGTNAIVITQTGSTSTIGSCIAIGTSATPITTATSATSAVRVYSDFSNSTDLNYHVGAWFSSRYTATGDAAASVYTLRGHAEVSGTLTAASGSQYIEGVHGRVIVTGAIVNSAAMVMGMKAEVLDGSASTTTVSHMACLWADWQNTDTVTGETECLYLTDNAAATTVDQCMFIYGDFSYFIKFDNACTTFVDATATAGDQCVGHIKIRYKDADAYVNVFSDNS